jgi:hypothetical protein
MANEFRFRIGDIPREKLEKPKEFIARYFTVLIYENQPCGSGTLVKCGDHFGILTAYHVPYNTTKDFNFRPNSPDKLGLSISNSLHAFYIEMQYLNPYFIGVPDDKKHGGPDMVFLKILDQSKLSLIKLYRSFWDIPIENGESMIKTRLSNSDSLWAIAGLPQSMVQEEQPNGNFNPVLGLESQTFFSGIEAPFESDGFDYIEMEANYKSKDPIPDCFKGVSGGGLWKIPMSIVEKNLDSLNFGEPALCGLQFCQTPLVGNCRRLRCHGCKSINSLFTKVLKDG